MPYPDDFSWDKFDDAMGTDDEWLDEDIEIWHALKTLSVNLDNLYNRIPSYKSYIDLREVVNSMRLDLKESITAFEDDSTARAYEEAGSYEDYDPNDRYDSD